jgi:hypothetical protein
VQAHLRTRQLADTAGRFIQVGALADEIPQVAEFAIPISGLYMLAAPSTPKEARNDIIERAEAGESVAVSDIKQTIETAKRKRKTAKQAAELKRMAELPEPEQREAAIAEPASFRTPWQAHGQAPPDNRDDPEVEQAAIEVATALISRAPDLAQKLTDFTDDHWWPFVEALRKQIKSTKVALTSTDDGLDISDDLRRSAS